MFKLIGVVIMFMLFAAAITFIIGALIVLGVCWAAVGIAKAAHRSYESRPEQRMKRLRAQVLKPGEVDVYGF